MSRFKEQNKCCVCALYMLVQFFTEFCKARTWNDQVLHSLRKLWTMAANFSSFHLELNNLNTYLAWACFRATGVLNRSGQLQIPLVKYQFILDYMLSSHCHHCLSSQEWPCGFACSVENTLWFHQICTRRCMQP